MKSEKKKILSGKECEVMNYLPYFKEPPIDVIKRYKTIKRYALICHDKDYNEKGILESPHYHIYLDFGRATVPFDMVAKWFGIEPQYVNKVKKTGSLLDYLTHANDSAQFKHQYSPKEVTANFDFVQEAEIEKTFGDFNKYSYARQIKFVHDLPPEKSLKYYNELKKRWELEQAYRSLLPDRDIQVVFIYGKGGTGKTYRAKKLLEDMGYDYCISSSSNDLFQDYKGQWGIILDDIRDRSMSFEDMLKCLDNHTASTMFGRYNNKVFDGKIIVMTSSVPPNYWYKAPIRRHGELINVSSEDLNQFYRRIGCYIVMTDETITVYNDGLNEYGRPKGLGHVFENDIIKKKKEQQRNKTDFAALFGKMCTPATTDVFNNQQLSISDEKNDMKRQKNDFKSEFQDNADNI